MLGAAGLLVAGCGKSGSAGSEATVASSAAPVPSAPLAAPADTAALAPPMDPAADNRPEPVKLADFSRRLQAQRDALAAADGQLVGQVRGDLQRSAQADARATLAAYAGLVSNLIAASAQPPKLTGCLARASAPSAQAHDALATALASRRDKVQAVLAVTYRPLALADLAPLAGDASASSGTDPVKLGLASAQAAATACAAVANRPARLVPPRPVRQGNGAAPYSAAPTAAPPPAEEPPKAEASPAPVASPAPAQPKHKPGLLERLFSGGNHPN